MQIQSNQLLWCAWIQGCEEGKVGRSPSDQIGSSSWLVRSCVLQCSVVVMDICSGGGTYWRLLLCIISVQLSWLPQAMLKALEETSHPSLHSCCVSSCDSPQWFVSFPHRGLWQYTPFPNACRVCNSPLQFPSAQSSVFCCFWSSRQLPPAAPFHHVSRWREVFVPAASQTAGVSDSPGLTAVLRSRVTNCFSWGVMPAAQ